MPFFLKKTDDPARSWNIRTNEGLLFRNGLAQIYKLKAYIFKNNKLIIYIYINIM